MMVCISTSCSQKLPTQACSPELEPRRQRSDPVQVFVDLGATLEDHGEVNHLSVEPSFPC
jgi:hypothetical protein